MAAPIYFIGPNGPVDVPLARAANVSYGDAIEVADPAVRAGLLMQDGSWSEQDPKKKAPKSEAAPAADTSKE